MFALVADVRSYPDFLPWCRGATIHEESSEAVEATLDLERGGMTKSFRTRNSLTPHTAMHLALVGGPFRHLDGDWRFEQLGEDGSKVSLELEFEFESRLIDALFGSFFEETCNALIDSFVERASQVYG